MKTSIALMCILAVVTAADIDWSKVIPFPSPELIHRPAALPQSAKKFEVEPRIVRGQDAYPHQFPYQAGLIITFPTFTAFCGAVLISNKYLLTAAHCADNATKILVILGAHNIMEDEPTQQKYTVDRENIKVHEEWDSDRIINDLAILTVIEGITLVPGIIEPIKLPGWSDQGKQYTWASTITAGWGKISDTSSKISPTLQYADSWVMIQQVCALQYPGSIKESHICMNSVKSSTCNGDSGGGLTTNVNGVPILIGTTSFGFALCSLTLPSVFTRTTSFLPWIDENTQHSIIGN